MPPQNPERKSCIRTVLDACVQPLASPVPVFRVVLWTAIRLYCMT